MSFFRRRFFYDDPFFDFGFSGFSKLAKEMEEAERSIFTDFEKQIKSGKCKVYYFNSGDNKEDKKPIQEIKPTKEDEVKSISEEKNKEVDKDECICAKCFDHYCEGKDKDLASSSSSSSAEPEKAPAEDAKKESFAHNPQAESVLNMLNKYLTNNSSDSFAHKDEVPIEKMIENLFRSQIEELKNEHKEEAEKAQPETVEEEKVEEDTYQPELPGMETVEQSKQEEDVKVSEEQEKVEKEVVEKAPEIDENEPVLTCEEDKGRETETEDFYKISKPEVKAEKEETKKKKNVYTIEDAREDKELNEKMFAFFPPPFNTLYTDKNGIPHVTNGKRDLIILDKIGYKKQGMIIFR